MVRSLILSTTIRIRVDYEGDPPDVRDISRIAKQMGTIDAVGASVTDDATIVAVEVDWEKLSPTGLITYSKRRGRPMPPYFWYGD